MQHLPAWADLDVPSSATADPPEFQAGGTACAGAGVPQSPCTAGHLRMPPGCMHHKVSEFTRGAGQLARPLMLFRKLMINLAG